jgi:hypothetical protein
LNTTKTLPLAGAPDSVDLVFLGAEHVTFDFSRAFFFLAGLPWSPIFPLEYFYLFREGVRIQELF